MKSPDKKVCCLNENTYDCLLSPWSFIHVLSGYILALICFVLLSEDTVKIFVLSNIIHAGYEVKDYINTYVIDDRVVGNIDDDSWGNNSLINSVGDQISCNVGILIFLYVKPFLKKINMCKFLIVNLIGWYVIKYIFGQDLFLSVDIG